LDALIGDLRSILDAGARGVLIREPQMTDADLLGFARAARELFADGWLGVHDRAHIAMAAGADAVHLGFRSLGLDELASFRSTGFGVGVSHHEPELELEDMRADYRLLGPVHPTPSKAGWAKALGPDALKGMPLARETWAVGGIGFGQVAAVLETGVAGVAAIGSILGSDDPGAGMEAMLEAAEAMPEGEPSR